MQSLAEPDVAGVQCRTGLRVARRDVVQNEDVVVNVRIAARQFPRDRLFKQLHAGLDALCQGYQVQNEQAIIVILDLGRVAARGGLHGGSPSVFF